MGDVSAQWPMDGATIWTDQHATIDGGPGGVGGPAVGAHGQRMTGLGFAGEHFVIPSARHQLTYMK